MIVVVSPATNAKSGKAAVVDLRRRGAAIELSEHPLEALDGVAMVKVWRENAPPHVTH